MSSFMRKYGVETTIVFPVPKLNDTDFAATGDWTPAATDIRITKDAGTLVDCSNTAVAVSGAGSLLWALTLTATEMEAAVVTLQIVDAVLEHDAITVETYGHANAQHAFDLDTAIQGVNVTQISGDTTAANNLELQYDTTGLNGSTFPASQAQADRNADLTESHRSHHTWQGNFFYVDPVGGATHGSGARGGRNDPYLTIQDCHDNAVTDSNHDIIFLIAGHGSTTTTHTVAATTTISKRYVFIRGPGRDFIITRTGAGDTLAISADGVEISGVQIGTAATGSGDGIDITDADFVHVRDCWFLDTQGDGVHILKGSNCSVMDCHFKGTGVGGTGQGVHISGSGGSSDDNTIRRNHFDSTAGDSILIEQGTTNDTTIADNQIHDSSGWAINIGGSSARAFIHSNVFGNNASGNITDAGSNTIDRNNRDWLSATTEGRTLDVTATGAAGIDWGNIENKTTVNDLTQTVIQLCDTVTTLTGHTNQTGDSYARIGANGAGLTNINLPNQTMNIIGNITGNLSGSVGSVSGSVGSVTGAVGSVSGHTNQTGDSYARIGAAGASLSDLGGMSTGMKAQILVEADKAIGTTTYAEPSSVPNATASMAAKVSWATALSINKGLQTDGLKTLRNDADGADIATSTVSSDGTTFTRGKWA